MKLSTAALLTLAISVATASPILEKRANPKGIDVSHFQGTVNFNTVKANGLAFAYIKATEGTSEFYLDRVLVPVRHTKLQFIAFEDPDFSTHYDGATTAGLIRGGYHFAHPDESSGATQAKFFLAHGGKLGRSPPLNIFPLTRWMDRRMVQGRHHAAGCPRHRMCVPFGSSGISAADLPCPR